MDLASGSAPAATAPRRSLPHPVFAARELGPATIGLLVVAQAVLWTVARPSGESSGSYAGQLLGAESVLLLSIGLVLISTLPLVEAYFDGIDRAAIWHRRVAITGLLLLAPHVALASGQGSTLGGPLATIGALGMVGLAVWAILPRWRSVVPRPLRGAVLAVRDASLVRAVFRPFSGYERWRSLHRTTGLFVAAGFAHGLLDGTPFAGAPVLRWSYIAVGGVGLAFYAYRELLSHRFASLHDYQVAAVRRVGEGLTEIALRPLGRAIEFAPGQFAMIYIEGKDGWHRHPFTIASAPHEDVVRVAVKALGDYTSRLQELVQPGMPAVIGGPHGRFVHWRGTDRQIWLAGGVGVAPFLSWLRALDRHPLPECVDFFYSADGEAPFADELRSIAAREPSLHLHLVDTSVDGRLTPDALLAAAGGDPRSMSVFMCGPTAMLRAFETQLRLAGVRARRIHREHFDWR